MNERMTEHHRRLDQPTVEVAIDAGNRSDFGHEHLVQWLKQVPRC